MILTALCYFLVLPFFTRLLRFFPPIVIGTMLLLVAVNLIRIFGSLIIGKPGSDGYAAPLQILLALATMGSIGRTHGVKAKPRPAKNSSTNASQG